MAFPKIPRPSVKFLDNQGIVNLEWYRFLDNFLRSVTNPVGFTGDEAFLEASVDDLSPVDTWSEPTYLAWLLGLEEDPQTDYSRIPRVTTPTAPDRRLVGKCLEISAGITIPANVFSLNSVEGDVFYVYNGTSGALTLTQGSGLTLRLGGTGTTGNRTIPQFGMCKLWFPSTAVCITTENVT